MSIPKHSLVIALLIILGAAGIVSPYNPSGLRWPSPSTSFNVLFGPLQDRWSRAFESAMFDWTDRTYFEFIPVGDASSPCSDPSVSPPGNGVAFGATACGLSWGSAVAFTKIWSVGGTIIQSGTVFNSNVQWDIYSGAPRQDVFDLRRIAVHELGHAAGLSHEDAAASIMSSVPGSVEVPQPDDILGINSIYPFAAAGPNPPPEIQGVSPEPLTVAPGPVEIAIRGINFVPGAVVSVDETALPTSFINKRKLVVTIPAANLAKTGTLGITVVNPIPGGGRFSRNVPVNNPLPVITSVIPGSFSLGSSDVQIGISGNGFVSDSTVTINDVRVGATFTNNALLSATIPAARVNPGMLVVSVANPAPGGGTASYSIIATSTDNSVRAFTVGGSASAGALVATAGGPGSLRVGYARVQTLPGAAAPSGLAVIGYRQNGVLVSETAVSASPLIQIGRIYAETSDTLNTGLAMANPNNRPNTIRYFFTDSEGRNFSGNSYVIPANGQIAKFLTEAPFNLPAGTKATFSFTSDLPLFVTALRGLINERTEFLLSTLPVANIVAANFDTVVVPQFVSGSGWTTQLVIVNPLDLAITGQLEFLGNAGPLIVSINGQSASRFPYTVAPRSFAKFDAAGQGSSTSIGLVRVTPSLNNRTPSVLSTLTFRPEGTTTTSATVIASSPGSAFRMYAQLPAPAGSSGATEPRTGLAVANSATTATTVTLTLTPLSGASPSASTNLVVPGGGQVSVFLEEIPGFQNVSRPFEGMLRIVAPASAPVAVTGLRGRSNERGDFLMTTTPPIPESSIADSAEIGFPHFADSDGYTTQFILLASPAASQPASGVIGIYSPAGSLLPALLR